MWKMMWKTGDTEREMDLAEIPEFVLVQFCDLILRKRDLRDPKTRSMFRELVDALKIKAEETPVGPGTFDRVCLKEQIAQAEDLLDRFDQPVSNLEA